jgi:hypothetical protein
MSKRPPFHSLSACFDCGATGDDLPSANVEAFEITGEIMCDDCWQDHCERQWEREPDTDAPTFDETYRAAWTEHQEAHKR